MARMNSKQYVVLVETFAAGIKSKRAAPNSPERKSLFVQNTGAASGLFRIGGDVRRDGGDVLLTAGQAILWDQADTCPTEDLNFMALAATTTFCVIEGISGNG